MKFKKIILCMLVSLICFGPVSAMAKSFTFSLMNDSKYPITSINYEIDYDYGLIYKTESHTIQASSDYNITTNLPAGPDGSSTFYDVWVNFKSIQFLDANGKTHTYNFQDEYACSVDDYDNFQVIRIQPRVAKPVKDSDFMVYCIWASHKRA